MPGARFCEECGFDFGTAENPAAPDSAGTGGMLRGPVLWAVMIVWAAIAIGALAWIYSAAIRQ
ncbi:MAG: hypothetical protein IT305_14625 [Chloroflexi bacterium]|nr:hypothetical protein [Chloroflexota bacterium]